MPVIRQALRSEPTIATVTFLSARLYAIRRRAEGAASATRSSFPCFLPAHDGAAGDARGAAAAAFLRRPLRPGVSLVGARDRAFALLYEHWPVMGARAPALVDRLLPMRPGRSPRGRARSVGERTGQAAVAVEALGGIAGGRVGRERPLAPSTSGDGWLSTLPATAYSQGSGSQPPRHCATRRRRSRPRDPRLHHAAPASRSTRRSRRDGTLETFRAKRVRIAHTPSLSRSRHALHAASTSAVLSADTRSDMPAARVFRFPPVARGAPAQVATLRGLGRQHE